MEHSEYKKVETGKILSEFKTEIRYFNEYIIFNEEELQKRENRLSILLQEDIKSAPDLEYHFRSGYVHDFIKIPSYFYHSTLISLYTLLETTVNQICEAFIEETEFPLQLKNFSGNNLFGKAKLFLEKIAVIDLSRIDGTCVEISKFQNLRNLIVHQNSIIPIVNPENNKKKSKQYNLVKGIGNIKIDESEGFFIIQNSKPLFQFIKHIEVLIETATSQVQDNLYPNFDDIFRSRSHYTATIEANDDLPF